MYIAGAVLIGVGGLIFIGSIILIVITRCSDRWKRRRREKAADDFSGTIYD